MSEVALSEIVLGASSMVLSHNSPMYTCDGELFGNFEAVGLELPHGQFEQAMFTDIRFETCDFSDSSFEKCALTRVCFDECDLAGVDFSSAELEDVTFIGCDLTNVNLESSTLKNITITDCKGAIDLSDSEIVIGVFYGCDLTGTSLYDTNLESVVFGKCNLTKALISVNTVFTGVKFTNCDITELPLTLAHGGEDVVLHQCEYKPFSTLFFTERSRSALQLPPIGGTSRNYTYVNRWDYSAVIACSSIEEYKAAK